MDSAAAQQLLLSPRMDGLFDVLSDGSLIRRIHKERLLIVQVSRITKALVLLHRAIKSRDNQKHHRPNGPSHGTAG